MNEKNKVLITEDLHPFLSGKLKEMGFVIDLQPEISNEKVGEIIQEYYGLVISTKVKVNASLIDKAGKLRFVARAGSGMENVDTSYAATKDIYCCNSPEGNRDAVAEHAIGMLMCLFNKIGQSSREVKDGIWLREKNRGEELMGKTVGLIGYGNTGQAMAKKLSGFDVKILVYDKYIDTICDSYVIDSSLDDLYKVCDVLSLHVPLTFETDRWVDLDFLNRFTKPLYLINTSRGKVVKTSDLVKALETGKVKGAVLDVLENEKIGSLNEVEKAWFESLVNMNQVIITPHVAGWTHQSKLKIAQVLINRISKWYHKES